MIGMGVSDDTAGTCITFPCQKQVSLPVLRELVEPALQEYKVVPGLKIK